MGAPAGNHEAALNAASKNVAPAKSADPGTLTFPELLNAEIRELKVRRAHVNGQLEGAPKSFVGHSPYHTDEIEGRRASDDATNLSPDEQLHQAEMAAHVLRPSAFACRVAGSEARPLISGCFKVYATRACCPTWITSPLFRAAGTSGRGCTA